MTKSRSALFSLFLAAAYLISVFAISSVDSYAGSATYVGTKKCKMCHNSKKKGAQYKVWEKSGHANAYKTLGTAKAKELGAKAGVSDPQNDPKCTKCHVTGYNADAASLGKKYKKEDGVGCESCHGAGSNYIKKKVMEAITLGKKDAASVGLAIPDEKVCKSCHNSESPSFKDFNYQERLKKISHPMPEDYKSSKGYK